MQDTLKKAFFTLVGAAAVTAEKVTEIVDELVKKGEITSEEGKKWAKEVQEKADVAQKEYSQKIKKEVENTMNKFGYVKKDEFDALKKELDAVKSKVGQGQPKKAAPKKAAPKKKTE